MFAARALALMPRTELLFHQGKGPGIGQGLPRPSLHHRRLVYSRGRTQPDKSPLGAPVPLQIAPAEM